ncbi:DUF4446 family protein [Patescibacteria group bacterium]|nr:MAG: DUF4446 family protein [Patescibacteria group bacterium]
MESVHVVLEYIVESVQHNPVITGLLVLVLWSLIQDFVLFRRLRRLVRGGDGKTLEGTIRKLQERVANLEAYATKTTNELNLIHTRVKKSIRGVAMKQFDPFGGTSGQQSFSTAFIDEDGNGVVVSSLHARDGVRVYGKAIKKFVSVRELSDEEKETVNEAKQKL